MIKVRIRNRWKRSAALRSFQRPVVQKPGLEEAAAEAVRRRRRALTRRGKRKPGVDEEGEPANRH